MENNSLFCNVLILDDFVTPSSTPPGEASEAAASEESNVFNEDLSDAALHDKIYDKLVRCVNVDLSPVHPGCNFCWLGRVSLLITWGGEALNILSQDVKTSLAVL